MSKSIRPVVAGLFFRVSAAILCTLSAARADEPILLPPVVVSATRIPTPADRLGSAVTVIDRAAIEASGRTSVDELLRRVPGVTVVNSGGPGARSDLFLRGADEDQTLVLIDGVPVNDPASTGGRFDFAGLSTAGIERIEVLRGPQSALYGAEAIGGVVNIVTRRGEAGSPRFHGGIEGGSYGTFRGDAGVSAGGADWDLALDAAHLTTDGFSRVRGGAEDDGASLSTLSARAGYRVSESFRLDAAARFEDAFAELDPTTTTDGFAEKDDQVYTGRIGGALDLLGGRWHQRLDLFGSLTERRFEDPTSVSRFDGGRIGAEYRHDLRLDDRNTLTLGTRVMRDYGRAVEDVAAGRNERYDRAEDSVAGYGLYQVELFDRLNLTAGARIDDFEAFGSELTYRLTAAVPIPETGTVLRGSYATGAKAPTIQQRFDDTFLFGFLRVRGNPDLDVERSRGWDIGIEQAFLGRRVVASVTGFHNDIDDLIEFDAAAGTFLQVDEAETRGVEVELTLRPLDWLGVAGSYTYLRAEDRGDGTALARRPRHTASLTVDASITDRLSLQANILFVGERFNQAQERGELNDYTRVNVAARYRLLDQLELFGRIDNLFDVDYEEVAGLATPGRSFFAGLRASF